MCYDVDDRVIKLEENIARMMANIVNSGAISLNELTEGVSADMKQEIKCIIPKQLIPATYDKDTCYLKIARVKAGSIDNKTLYNSIIKYDGSALPAAMTVYGKVEDVLKCINIDKLDDNKIDRLHECYAHYFIRVFGDKQLPESVKDRYFEHLSARHVADICDHITLDIFKPNLLSNEQIAELLRSKLLNEIDDNIINKNEDRYVTLNLCYKYDISKWEDIIISIDDESEFEILAPLIYDILLNDPKKEKANLKRISNLNMFEGRDSFVMALIKEYPQYNWLKLFSISLKSYGDDLMHYSWVVADFIYNQIDGGFDGLNTYEINKLKASYFKYWLKVHQKGDDRINALPIEVIEDVLSWQAHFVKKLSSEQISKISMHVLVDMVRRCPNLLSDKILSDDTVERIISTSLK